MKLDEVINDLKSIRSKDPKNRNWSRVWEPFLRKYRCDYVCELGVYKGENFLEMIKHNPKVAVAVDSWVDDRSVTRNDGRYSQQELNNQYEFFKNLVANKPFVKIIRDYTFNAVKHFPNNYFDFVYMDADHSFEGCFSDLISWYPKVKKDRFLLGHDYSGRHKEGVVKAVDKFTQENSLRLVILYPSIWAVVKK